MNHEHLSTEARIRYADLAFLRVDVLAKRWFDSAVTGRRVSLG